MWISRALSAGRRGRTAEKGTITIPSVTAPEANASSGLRNIAAFAPYGYASAPPVGEEVILVPSADGQAALGTRCSDKGLEPGEIEITSRGGASIRLGNDGCIYLNGQLFMNENGVTIFEL